MKRAHYLILGLLAVALLTVSPVYANLLQNGDFASGPAIVFPGFTTVQAGDPSITNWTVTGYSVDYIGNYWQAPDGATRSIDLDGSPPYDNGSGSAQSGIQQAFATTPGATYQVSFYLAGNPDGSPSSKQVLVTTVGSNTYTFDASGTSKGSMGWTLESFDFTATSTSTTLSFDSQTPGYYGPVIGEVSVSQIPLPPSALLLGTGLVGLVGLGWRKGRVG